jgi:hypothetical protein
MVGPPFDPRDPTPPGPDPRNDAAVIPMAQYGQRNARQPHMIVCSIRYYWDA